MGVGVGSFVRPEVTTVVGGRDVVVSGVWVTVVNGIGVVSRCVELGMDMVGGVVIGNVGTIDGVGIGISVGGAVSMSSIGGPTPHPLQVKLH